MSVIKKNIIINMFFLSFIFAVEDGHVIVNIIEQDKNHIVLEYIINDFYISEISVKDEVYHDIDLEDEPDFLNKYSPKLPHINRSLIVPDMSSMNVSVLSSDYTEYDNINILPSKGNLSRLINPEIER